MFDSSYTGTINDFLGIESNYNNKLIIQEGNLVYVASEVSLQEKEWLENLGIEEASDYYTVEFDSAGGTEISSQTIKTGKSVKKPNDPIKIGHDFLGWYYLKQSGSEDNPTYTEIEFDFNTKIICDYSLYAKYTDDAVMMARNNNYAFWQSDIRDNITNIIFTDDDSLIPDNPEYSWDIRADKVNGGTLMAYLSNSENLIIYSPYTVYANSNSSNYFNSFSKLNSINFDNFDTSMVTTMYAMFRDCRQLSDIDVSRFDTSKVINICAMFYNCNELLSIDVSQFNTSKVTNIGAMFKGCSQLSSIDVSRFDTSKVTSMMSMFSGDWKLSSIDVSNFDTSNVTNIAGMFCDCSGLSSIDVSEFDTSMVTNMSEMFRGCRQLASINVSKFDTSKVTSMYAMFYNCQQLKSIDLSNFDTRKVTATNSMFGGCINLNELKFKNWKVSNLENVTSNTKMFNSIPKSAYIYVDDIDMKNWILNIRSDFENIKVNEL